MLVRFDNLTSQVSQTFDLIKNKRRFNVGEHYCRLSKHSENVWFLSLINKVQKIGFQLDISFDNGPKVTGLTMKKRRDCKTVYLSFDHLKYMESHYIKGRKLTIFNRFNFLGDLLSLSINCANNDCIYYQSYNGWLRQLDIMDGEDASARQSLYENRYPNCLKSNGVIHSEPIIYHIDDVEARMNRIFDEFDAIKFFELFREKFNRQSA